MHCSSLFSGSSGNSILVREGSSALLVDAGVSFRRLQGALCAEGLRMEDLDGVFFTHEHADHTGALPMILKKTHLPLFLAEECAEAVYQKFLEKDAALADLFCRRVYTVRAEHEYEVGEFVLTPFDLPHDSVSCLGVCISSEHEENALGIATDLGQLTADARRALSACENVILESNHDVAMLSEGPYPAYLKERILSDFGHLSNEDCAIGLQALAAGKLRRAMLFHLSGENNRPSKALSCATQALKELSAEGEITLCIAREDCTTPLF